MPSCYSLISFWLATLCLWNQVDDSHHQPHLKSTSSTCPPSFLLPFSPSTTPSLFYNQLQNTPILQILLTSHCLLPSGTPSQTSTQDQIFLPQQSSLLVLSVTFSVTVSSGKLSWLIISFWCMFTYFMTYFYAPISTIVSGVLQPPIISLQRSVTIIIRPTL